MKYINIIECILYTVVAQKYRAWTETEMLKNKNNEKKNYLIILIEIEICDTVFILTKAQLGSGKNSNVSIHLNWIEWKLNNMKIQKNRIREEFTDKILILRKFLVITGLNIKKNHHTNHLCFNLLRICVIFRTTSSD